VPELPTECAGLLPTELDAHDAVCVLMMVMRLQRTTLWGLLGRERGAQPSASPPPLLLERCVEAHPAGCRCTPEDAELAKLGTRVLAELASVLAG